MRLFWMNAKPTYRDELNKKLEAHQKAEFGGKKCFKCGEREAEIGLECIPCAMARPERWPGSVEAKRQRIEEMKL